MQTRNRWMLFFCLVFLLVGGGSPAQPSAVIKITIRRCFGADFRAAPFISLKTAAIEEQREQQIRCSGLFKPSRCWRLTAVGSRLGQRGWSSSGDQMVSAWPTKVPWGTWTGNGIAVTSNQDKADNQGYLRKQHWETIRRGVEAEPGELWLDEMSRRSEQVQVRLSAAQQLQRRRQGSRCPFISASACIRKNKILNIFTLWNNSLFPSSPQLIKSKIWDQTSSLLIFRVASSLLHSCTAWLSQVRVSAIFQ